MCDEQLQETTSLQVQQLRKKENNVKYIDLSYLDLFHFQICELSLHLPHINHFNYDIMYEERVVHTPKPIRLSH